MTALFYAATAAVLVNMALIVGRGLVGPTVYDRILAANAFGTSTIVLIVLVAFLNGEMMYLDIAMTYALINFIGTVVFLKYFNFDSLGK